MLQEWRDGPNRNGRNKIEKAPASSADLRPSNSDFHLPIQIRGANQHGEAGAFVLIGIFRLFQEIEYGFFDCDGVSLDNIFESDGQRIELCETLGNVVTVCLVGNEVV